ncbi:conserved hypothetical protein [Candida dubliniensis CD36]|uniref:Topoisomerase I damage affected protein 11 n=1 Tax=Candida dubliniensis (strain CD36 / ATCC MYA-646 / CBS 7987 / NCPF 3949 / NRRL Y-17841) TaxID=573826 RepID=B9WFP6_CANDC|nr:conserved hypothetical protein [Candida dubliniensis CD36]CAX42065.1 conserved hypothetical protein [Candida dubliniensis CD36]
MTSIMTANSPELTRTSSIRRDTRNSKTTPRKSTTSSLNQPLEFKIKRSSSLSSNATSSSEASVKRSSSLRNSTSTNKGLNIFAVSPLPNSATCETPTERISHQRKLSSYASPTLTQVSESNFPNDNQNLRYDVPLPSQDKLIAMDIDEQLRYLALKEMCIVELKDNINNLNNKLKYHNKELHKLREIIQRSLYKELSSESTATKNNQSQNNRPRQNSNPRDEAIARTRTRRRSSLFHDNREDHLDVSPSNSISNASTSQESSSKLWSGLTKPLDLIQQFDSMLQNEFEKSLINERDQKRQLHSDNRKRLSHQSKSSEGSISSIGSITSPLQAKSKAFEQKKSNSNNRTTTDDMLQNVSSSIWSFVNDVKNNVLSSLNEVESETRSKPTAMYNLETGSAVDIRGPRKLVANESEGDSDTDLLEPVASDDEDNLETLDLSIYRR